MTQTVMDAAMMLNVLAGYDRLDIGERRTLNRRRCSGAEAVCKRFQDRDRASAVLRFDRRRRRAGVEDALRVVAKLTRSVTDTMLPSTGDVMFLGETYACHGEMFGRESVRYLVV